MSAIKNDVQTLTDVPASAKTAEPPNVVASRPPAVSQRRLPIGADLQADGVHFRLWAPDRKKVEVVLAEGIETLRPIPLKPEGDGYFSVFVERLGAGTLYRYRLDSQDDLLPDPASRYQPEGPMGPSEVIDPDAFVWTDQAWAGVKSTGNVLYEMHIGAFTNEGTYGAAIDQLPELAELGITIIEIMPVADFAGRFGWGYDGVNLFAPTRLYGGPDDFPGVR